MIRAGKGLKPGEARFVREYEGLKSFWQVTPHLETLLGDDLEEHLGSLEM